MNKKYYMFKMNMSFLNILSIILILLSVLVFYLIYGDQTKIVFASIYTPFILIYVPYLACHELFHSLAYVIHGAKFKNITYGVHLEKGVLCCLCKQNIDKKNILFSLIYPLVFLGFITFIIGIVINSPLLVALSLANISGCSGDIVMFYHLVKLQNFEFSEYDDPTSFGIYTANNLSEIKLFGLDYVGNKESLKRDDLRKIVISKMSIIILMAFYLLILMTMFI